MTGHLSLRLHCTAMAIHTSYLTDSAVLSYSIQTGLEDVTSSNQGSSKGVNPSIKQN